MTVGWEARLTGPADVADRQLAQPVEEALRQLLERNPSAEVGVVDPVASTTPVPAPVWIRTQVSHLVQAPGLFQLVIPTDRVVVAKLWGQARAAGSAMAPVRMLRQPEEAGRLHLFDLCRRHGVMIFVFLDSEAEPYAIPTGRHRPAVTPRFARASKDAGSVFRWVDPALPAMLGCSTEAMVGRRALEFVHPDDHDRGIANWLEMLEAPGPGPRTRLRNRHNDGSWVWLEVTNHNRLSDAGHADILTEIVDVSEEMAAHEALRSREQLLAQLTDTVAVGLFHADVTGNVLFTNRRLHAITGVATATTLDEQLAAVTAADRPALARALRATAEGAAQDIELDVRPGGGELRHCRLSVRPLSDDDGTVTGMTGCLDDVTAMVRARRELEVRAMSDLLTGCLNREATLGALQLFLDRPPAPGEARARGTAVIFVDLDGFKRINDERGHAAGDACLIAVAKRIRGSIRSGDLLGRIGGDEFVVVCPGVAGPSEALDIARSLGRHAFRPHLGRPGEAPLRASIGVAWADHPGAQATHLVQAADTAMYESKRAGRNEPAMAATPAPDRTASPTPDPTAPSVLDPTAPRASEPRSPDVAAFRPAP